MLVNNFPSSVDEIVLRSTFFFTLLFCVFILKKLPSSRFHRGTAPQTYKVSSPVTTKLVGHLHHLGVTRIVSARFRIEQCVLTAGLLTFTQSLSSV